MAATGSLVSSDVRRHNLAVILEHLAHVGPSARSEIAEATGLTRGAVTALATLLTDAGIVREQEPSAATRGRPLTKLELAADGIAILVLQLDADQATVLATDLSGATLFRASEHHGRPMGRPDLVLDTAAAVLEHGLAALAGANRRIAELTVVAFAPVGGEPARVLADTDLGWGEVDVVAGLRDRLAGLPEHIGLVSDSAVAATAELGILPEVRDALYVKSNSGIGGAILVEGRLVSGIHGAGGAIGHLAVVPDGEVCECGQRGCLVTVAGPDALLHASGLGPLLVEAGLNVATAEFVRRIASGDEPARAAWSAATRWIGHALRLLTLTTDPAVIVVGGYWAALVPSIEAEFRAGLPTYFIQTHPATPGMLAGALGDDAALIGAVQATRARLLAEPSLLGL